MYFGTIPKDNKKAAAIRKVTPYQIKWGEVTTNIEYKALNTTGEIIRPIESNTHNAPNNWPIWDGATKFVCSDFITEPETLPNEAITDAI